MTSPLRLDEHATFHAIELAGAPHAITGHFRLERATGSLAYAPTMFVVEDETGRVWPLAVVVALHANLPTERSRS